MVSAVAAQEEIKELHCIVSCNTALAAYFDWLVEAVGVPAAPVLVADSLTATSLSLEWELPERLIAFTSSPVRRPLITDSYLVQWRYEEMAGDWKFCRNQSIARNNGTVRVDNLHPYTKYRVSDIDRWHMIQLVSKVLSFVPNLSPAVSHRTRSVEAAPSRAILRSERHH